MFAFLSAIQTQGSFWHKSTIYCNIHHMFFLISLLISLGNSRSEYSNIDEAQNMKKINTKQGSYSSRVGICLNYLPGPSSAEGGDGRWGKEKTVWGKKEEREMDLPLSTKEWVELLRKPSSGTPAWVCVCLCVCELNEGLYFWEDDYVAAQ